MYTLALSFLFYAGQLATNAASMQEEKWYNNIKRR